MQELSRNGEGDRQFHYVSYVKYIRKRALVQHCLDKDIYKILYFT